jgi:predicted GIY-YIG superfamily endonuclease
MALMPYPADWRWGHQVWVNPGYPASCTCPHENPSAGHTLVYTIYDMYGDGVLYVGVTNNVPRRFRQHMRTKSWWDESENAHLECHDSRQSALVAEFLWIRYHRPRHNIVGKALSGVEYQVLNPMALMLSVND